MTIKDDNRELTDFLKLSDEARKKVEDWPEWKRTLRLTKYSEGFGARISEADKKICKE